MAWDDGNEGVGSTSKAGVRGRLRYLVCLTLLFAFAVVYASAASADDGESIVPPKITPADIEEGVREGSSPEYQADLTNPDAAEELPHSDLNREQALDLMQSVFDPLLEAPAGVFDELHVERFLSDNAAILPAGEQLESPGATIGAPPSDRYEGPTLIESTIPLRTDDANGPAEAVDLGLEHDEEELQPASPLVEVGIPDDLSEGITLPETGVQINLEGAPKGRAPSTVDQSVAAYPEVAEDTSLAISPTPTGVETMTILQSPEAPTSQTFYLSLPQGAELKPTKAGGAEVVKDGQPILGIATPTALDADERAVPVSLGVSGNSLTLQVSPDAEASWPIAVDPIYETYNWWNGITGLGGWGGWTNAASNYYRDSHDHCDPFASPYSCQTGETSNAPGLFIGALPGAVAEGSTVNWEFVVPRWFEEWEKYSQPPSTWISSMYLGNVGFWQRSDWAADPTLWMGLWNTGGGGWVSGRSASGNYPGMNGNWSYEFLAGQNAFSKLASFSLVNPSGYDLTAFRDAFVNTAIISLVDTDKPKIGSVIAPQQWVNKLPTEPISVTARDEGLGVYRLKASAENVPQSSSWPVQTQPCTGTTIYPCKGTATFNLTKHGEAPNEVRDYDPSVMPQGIDNILVTAEDPLGNQSLVKDAEVYVDHTPPGLSLSGSATEQAGSGLNLSQYSLKYSATDGDGASPVALSPFGTSGSGPGQMLEPKGTAIDPSGNIWVVDRGNHRVMEYDKNGNYLMQFGSSGTGNGQFSDPRGIAIASNGTIWVSDMGNNDVQAFKSNGEFLRKITNASFEDPYGVATGPGGVLWVSDITSDKLFKFNENGTFIKTAVNLTQNPQKTVEIKSPTGLATDTAGNVWLVDYIENRVQKYNANGEFVMQFGTTGSGQGQFLDPVGVAVAPSGNLLITDTGNNRVEDFQPTGHFLRQFGSAGSGNGNFSVPVGIAIGRGNKAFVVDSNNHRVARWEHADRDRQSGVVSAEVKVDGQLVEPKYAPGCPTENCAINNREWTLQANKYSSGQHVVKVTATDGVGLSTSKEFTITTDNTPPQLNSLSGFYTAPDGWLEQRSYYPSASASDAGGSGLKSMTLKIDGKVVKSVEQSCPSKGCEESLSTPLDVSTYKGGAHQGELIATDVAGNVAKKVWTINVDPKGEISAAEATDTLEASDETAETTIVSPNSEVISQEERENGNDPTLEEVAGGAFITKGAPTETEIPNNPSDPITIPTPEGSVQIDPASTLTGNEAEIANESALVTPNTTEHVDTVIRPVFDGILSFAVIRSSEAPESYSWQVLMGKGQTLVQLSEQYAEVKNANGTSAVSIQAQPAHDATGKELTTSIKIEGSNIVTLTVHHRVTGITYPVVGGPGFQVGYEAVLVFPPPEEQKEAEGGIGSDSEELFVGAPEPIPSGEATISTAGGSRREYVKVACGHTEFFSAGESYTEACGNPFTGNQGFGVNWQLGMRGAFLYKPGSWAEQRGAIKCAQAAYVVTNPEELWYWNVKEASECHYGPRTSDGNGGEKVSAGHYLRAQAHWEVGHWANCAGYECPSSNPVMWEDKAQELHLWPSGLAERVVP